MSNIQLALAATLASSLAFALNAGATEALQLKGRNAVGEYQVVQVFYHDDDWDDERWRRRQRHREEKRWERWHDRPCPEWHVWREWHDHY